MNDCKTKAALATEEQVDTSTEALVSDKKREKTVTRKRRRIRGDRSDGRKVRTSSPMLKFTPYIMARRSDACNTYADSFDVTEIDRFCRQKVEQGYTNVGFLHVFLEAYV